MACSGCEARRKFLLGKVSEVFEMGRRLSSGKTDKLESQLKIERQRKKLDEEKAKLQEMTDKHKRDFGSK